MIGKFLLVGALAAFAAPVAATNLVANASFENPNVAAKISFGNNVASWSGGYNLTFLATPGSADDLAQYLTVYGPFPATSPDGGQFVEADGDPNYSSAIYQTISGLVANQNYSLTFYQAAGQQFGFVGPTTERWSVGFGGDTQLSPMYSLPQGGVGPWHSVSLTFTAHATSQVLSFLAVGTPGGAPPISFLDGISLSVPEPMTWALLVVGFGLVGVAARRRRTSASIAA